MNKVVKYFKDALGVELDIQEIKPEKNKTLPMYITQEYKIFQTSLFNRDVLLVWVKNDFTPSKLRKHIDIIKSKVNIITVAVIDQIESYNRLRLIENKMPFIIPGKQMYLPDLLIDLKEFGSYSRKQFAKMQPATQYILLYHLQVESLEGINFKEIAKKTNYNAITVSRVAYYLQDIGLCTILGAKNKYLHFDLKGKDLWNSVKDLMTSPINKTIYLNAWTVPDQMERTNINALAHYTDINDEETDFYAVNSRYFNVSLKVLVIANQKEGKLGIEEWKYDPRSLTKSSFVDPLSLYLCFKESSDERIQMALEQMINYIQW